MRDEAGNMFGLVGVSRDVTGASSPTRLRDGHAQTLEMISVALRSPRSSIAWFA